MGAFITGSQWSSSCILYALFLIAIARISKATVAKNAVAGEFSYSRASRCRRCLHRDVQGQGGQEVEVHLPDGGDQIALPKTVAAGVFCSNLSPSRKDFVFSEYNSICNCLYGSLNKQSTYQFCCLFLHKFICFLWCSIVWGELSVVEYDVKFIF